MKLSVVHPIALAVPLIGVIVTLTTSPFKKGFIVKFKKASVVSKTSLFVVLEMVTL